MCKTPYITKQHWNSPPSKNVMLWFDLLNRLTVGHHCHMVCVLTVWFDTGEIFLVVKAVEVIMFTCDYPTDKQE